MSRKSLIDFAMLSAWVGISLVLAVLAFSLGGIDFGVYYAAGRIVLQGGNPYDYDQLSTAIISSTSASHNPYYYAPWFTWAILPLALLPFKIARIAWALVNFILWFLGLINLNTVLDWPPAGWRRWGMYIVAGIVFAFSTWSFEQVGVLIFYLLTIALLFERQGRWHLLGFTLALMLFKPNITALPVLSMLAWLALRGNWKPVLLAAGSLGLLLGASLIISPGWYLPLAEPDKLTGLSYTLDAAGATQVARYNTTLMDWLAAYGINGIAAGVTYAAAVAAGLIFTIMAVRNSESFIQLSAVAFLIGLAITPYALFYDYPPLILTIFWSNSILSGRPLIVWTRTMLTALVVCSLAIGDTISYRYWMIPVAALLMATAYSAYKETTAGKRVFD